MGWDKSETDPIKWATDMKDAPREAINIFAFAIFNRVVMKTPVDTGAARQNWLVTLNSETDQYDPSKANTGGVLTDGEAIIDKAEGDDKIIIQNNLPYIKMLEFGGWPKNPKRGGLTKNGEPKTVGGFSRQAPQGMVGTTLEKADQLWDRAVKAAGGN